MNELDRSRGRSSNTTTAFRWSMPLAIHRGGLAPAGPDKSRYIHAGNDLSAHEA